MAKSLIDIDPELLSRAALLFHDPDPSAVVTAALTEAVERDRHAMTSAADMSFLQPASNAEFVQHVWDENGHL